MPLDTVGIPHIHNLPNTNCSIHNYSSGGIPHIGDSNHAFDFDPGNLAFVVAWARLVTCYQTSDLDHLVNVGEHSTVHHVGRIVVVETDPVAEFVVAAVGRTGAVDEDIVVAAFAVGEFDFVAVVAGWDTAGYTLFAAEGIVDLIVAGQSVAVDTVAVAERQSVAAAAGEHFVAAAAEENFAVAAAEENFVVAAVEANFAVAVAEGDFVVAAAVEHSAFVAAQANLVVVAAVGDTVYFAVAAAVAVAMTFVVLVAVDTFVGKNVEADTDSMVVVLVQHYDLFVIGVRLQ